MKTLAAIVAMTPDTRAIGVRNGLPWRVPEDLKRFKALTTGHAIIMGRKTWESIGRPLPQRHNIVVSRTPVPIEGCTTVASLDEAVRAAGDDPMPFLIGGAQLYALALPKLTHLFITWVARRVEADTFFPEFRREEWREVSRTPAKESADVTFADLVRIQEP